MRTKSHDPRILWRLETRTSSAATRTCSRRLLLAKWVTVLPCSPIFTPFVSGRIEIRVCVLCRLASRFRRENTKWRGDCMLTSSPPIPPALPLSVWVLACACTNLATLMRLSLHSNARYNSTYVFCVPSLVFTLGPMDHFVCSHWILCTFGLPAKKRGSVRVFGGLVHASQQRVQFGRLRGCETES
jgi:hypothetical protein